MISHLSEDRLLLMVDGLMMDIGFACTRSLPRQFAHAKRGIAVSVARCCRFSRLPFFLLSTDRPNGLTVEKTTAVSERFEPQRHVLVVEETQQAPSYEGIRPGKDTLLPDVLP